MSREERRWRKKRRRRNPRNEISKDGEMERRVLATERAIRAKDFGEEFHLQIQNSEIEKARKGFFEVLRTLVVSHVRHSHALIYPKSKLPGNGVVHSATGRV